MTQKCCTSTVVQVCTAAIFLGRGVISSAAAAPVLFEREGFVWVCGGRPLEMKTNHFSIIPLQLWFSIEKSLPFFPPSIVNLCGAFFNSRIRTRCTVYLTSLKRPSFFPPSPKTHLSSLPVTRLPPPPRKNHAGPTFRGTTSGQGQRQRELFPEYEGFEQLIRDEK